MEAIRDLVDAIFFGGKRKYLKEIEQQKENITQAFEEIIQNHNSETYYMRRIHDQWKTKWSFLKELSKKYERKKNNIKSLYDDQISLIAQGLLDENYLNNRNNKYVIEEITRNEEYFNSLEKYPLTHQQREAIVTDAYRNLVIAGAGTGKTSTLVGKVGYLIKKGLVKPDEILLLSYGRGAKDEMLERTQKRFSVSTEVSTFHGLGLKIISEVQGAKPRVSKLSSDQAALQKWIEEIIEKGKQNREFLSSINSFFINLTEYKTLWDFKTKGEYYEYFRTTQPRSLNGELVKSYEELEIANWLYTMGIEYKYEESYKYPTADKIHSQYKPDFYLPKYGLYIEHFGIDRNGNTAPYVPRETYLEEFSWKRSLHKKNGTNLVESFHYEVVEGNLLTKLESKLREKQVAINPIPVEVLFEKINKLGLVQPLTGLLSTFLNLYKSSGMSPEELTEKVRKTNNSPRTNAFVSIFTYVFKEYESELEKMGEVDFNDMINDATEYISKGLMKPNYGYILVDEFQDISQSRCKLLRAILDSNTDCKLFAVGDDWQSIYRFAGSDVDIMNGFEKTFGESKTLFIEDNFRFNNKICDLSTKFILANPKQIRKNLKPHNIASDPAVTLQYTSNTERDVNEILTKLEKKGGSVLILARYNYQRPEIGKYPNLSVQFMSAHRSKGLESDYVILIGLESGTMGFPCGIVDDPLFSLVMSESEDYPHAEERRLFYVAVTRARKHVYILADKRNPSVFVSELKNGGYELDCVDKNDLDSGVCPRCSATMRLVKGDFGQFYSCSNYPYCGYKAERCPSCGSESLLLKEGHYKCTNCGESFAQCSGCKEGHLVIRYGKYGQFLGCSNYPDCKHSQPI
jgi:DNA helicase-4